MTIKWPVRNSRVIPTAANSIVITVSMAGKTIATSGPIARPPKGGTSTWNTPSLPQGTYLISATALPNTDGTGTPQAAGTSTLTIVPNRNTQASVTMGSTVASVQMSSTSLLARPGFTFNVSATAFDSQGNMVLVADSALSWKISNPGALSMVKGGVDAQFKGVSNGSTSLTCTFTEVDSSLGQTPVSSPAASALTSSPGMAASGWPSYYFCNAQGTATSQAPAAGNQETTVAVPADFFLSAIEADGSLVGSLPNQKVQKQLEVLNADGSVRWTYTFTPSDVATPAVIASDGSIYLPEAADIRVLNPADGSTVATYPCPNASFALGNDGSIYWSQPVASNSDTYPLYATNPNGTPRWTSTFTPNDWYPTIGPDGTLYVTAKYGGPINWTYAVVALDPASGTTKWSYAEGTSTTWQPVVSANIVALQAGEEDDLHTHSILLNALTGKPLSDYTYPSVGSIFGSITTCVDSHDNVAWLTSVNSYPWQVLRMNPGGGGSWLGPFATYGPSTCLTSAAGGNIYYLGTQNTDTTASFGAYDPFGNLLWSYPYSTPTNAPGNWNHWPVPMVGSDGTVYLQPGNGLPVMEFAPAASPSTARKVKN
jgi:hypothetical protein